MCSEALRGCGRMTERVAEAGEIGCLRGLADVVDQWPHRLQRAEDLSADLLGWTHCVDGPKDSAFAVPGDHRFGHLVVQLESTPDDFLGVVGAPLKSGAGQ